MAEASDFRFGMQLGLPRHIIKSHPEEKWASRWARGATQNWGFPFNISATTESSDFKIGRLVGFAKARHKIPPRRKRGRGPGLGELPKMGVLPLIFIQWLKVSTSNLVHNLGDQFGPS